MLGCSNLLASSLLILTLGSLGCEPTNFTDTTMDKSDIRDVLDESSLYEEQVLNFVLPGEFDMCMSNPIIPEKHPGDYGYGLDLNTARWMAFFAGNSYGHHLRAAPLLEEMGFGDVGEAQEWRDHGSALILEENRAVHGTATERLANAKKVQSYVQAVVPGKKIQFFTAGDINKETNQFEYGSTQFAWVEHRTEPLVVIAFRGTEVNENADIWTDIDFFHYPVVGLGAFHRGFADAFSSVIEILSKKLRAEEGRGLKIYVTGHSLGGALAVLAAITVMRVAENSIVRDKFDPKMTNRLMGVYTFGKPRVGDDVFKAEVNSRVKEHEDFFGYDHHKVVMMRFRNEDDQVTFHPWSKPFWNQIYTHTGYLIHLKKRNEMGQLLLDMNPKDQDPMVETLLFSNMQAHSIKNYYKRISDHMLEPHLSHVVRRCGKDLKTRIDKQ